MSIEQNIERIANALEEIVKMQKEALAYYMPKAVDATDPDPTPAPAPETPVEEVAPAKPKKSTKKSIIEPPVAPAPEPEQPKITTTDALKALAASIADKLGNADDKKIVEFTDFVKDEVCPRFGSTRLGQIVRPELIPQAAEMILEFAKKEKIDV